MKLINKIMLMLPKVVLLGLIIFITSFNTVYSQATITKSFYPVGDNFGIERQGEVYTVLQQLLVGKGSGWTYVGYLKFNIGDIPKDVEVKSAKIKLTSNKDFGQIIVKHLETFVTFVNPKQGYSDLYNGGTTIAESYVTTGGNYAIADSKVLTVVNEVRKSYSQDCEFGFFPDKGTVGFSHSFGLSKSECYLSITYTLPTPSKPNVSVSDITTNSCKLSWEKDLSAEGYKIYLNDAYLKETTSTNCLIEGLESSTNYTLYVRAYNSVGSSSSDSKSVLTLPSIPTNFCVSEGCESAILSWDLNRGSNITYEIFNNNIKVGSVKDVDEYQVSDLEAPSGNYFKIRAVNSTGSSNYTNTVNVLIPAPLEIPSNYISNLQVHAIYSSKIVLAWTSVSGAEGYDIVQFCGGPNTFHTSSPYLIFDKSYFEIDKTYAFTIYAVKGKCQFRLCSSGFRSNTYLKSGNNFNLAEYGDIEWLEFPTTSTNIEIYPNPVEDNFYVSGSDIDRIQLINLSGKILIDTHDISSGINMSSFQTGVYLVKIYSKEEVVVKKILKK